MKNVPDPSRYWLYKIANKKRRIAAYSQPFCLILFAILRTKKETFADKVNFWKMNMRAKYVIIFKLIFFHDI